MDETPATLTKHTMPDLSHLYSSNMLNLMLDNLIGRTQEYGIDSYEKLGLWTNVVRLTDKALTHYESARGNLTAYVQGEDKSAFSLVFRAIDSFEDSVISSNRVLRMLVRLQDVGIGRAISLTSPAQADDLRLFRNMIEHTDGDLTSGKLRNEQSFVLLPLENFLKLGDRTLSYDTLSDCIERSYGFVDTVRK